MFSKTKKKKTCVTFSFVKPKQKNQKTFFHASLFLQKESKNQNHAHGFHLKKKRTKEKFYMTHVFFFQKNNQLLENTRLLSPIDFLVFSDTTANQFSK